ncbi:MAG: DUF418 domain-containing protein, partial [Candidatus Acidiferrales bacterium]
MSTEAATMQAAGPTTTVGAGPVAQAERIGALDTLRGFALLGILVMNIMSFSMIFSAYFNPTNWGDLTGANYWVWFGSHVLFEMKFMTLFSMLFGAGVLLFTERAEAKGESPRRLHYRRMLWLILFGALHGYLLWYGDILFVYGMCGLLVYLFRKCEPRTLIVLGILLIAAASALSVLFGWTIQFWPAEEVAKMQQMWRPDAAHVAAEINAYRGGWLEQMAHRVPLFFEASTVFFLMFFWRPAGVMLLGMALYKLGALSAQRSARFYATLVALGALVGLPLIVYGVRLNEAAGWDMRWSFFHGQQLNYWGSVLVSLGYVGLVMLVCKSGALAWLTARLAAVGQMAFTNYLLHTIICTTI